MRTDVLLLKAKLCLSVFQVKYSSGKSLLLDLTFLQPVDDLNRQLFLAIADVTRFGEISSKLLNVEFAESTSCKRKTSGENNTEKLKKTRAETSSSADQLSGQPCSATVSPISAPASRAISDIYTTSANKSITAALATQAMPSVQDDDGVVDSSQEPYAISLRK